MKRVIVERESLWTKKGKGKRKCQLEKKKKMYGFCWKQNCHSKFDEQCFVVFLKKIWEYGIFEKKKLKIYGIFDKFS